MLKNVVKRIPGVKGLAQLLGVVPKQTSARRFLLDTLPKNSVGAEIGVHLGDFSQEIIEIVFPKELHLIDPWERQTSATFKSALYGGEAKAGQKKWTNVSRRFAKGSTGKYILNK